MDPRNLPRQSAANDGGSPPRARFREAIVVRPKIAPSRSRIGGGKAWPLVVSLLTLVFGVVLLRILGR